MANLTGLAVARPVLLNGAMRQAIERGFKLAEMVESLLRNAGQWKIDASAQMAIVTNRYKPSSNDEKLADAVTDALPRAMAAISFAFALSSMLLGRPVMRMVTNSPRATPADLRQTVTLMSRLAADLERRCATVSPAR